MRNTLHLQMLHRQLLDLQAAPLTILNSGAKSPFTKAFFQLMQFLDQTNTIIPQNPMIDHGQQVKKAETSLVCNNFCFTTKKL